MLAKFRERREQEINALSATAAMGWTGLFNGLAGEDGHKATPNDFLPFNNATKKQSRISDQTRAVLSALVDRKKLPPVLMNSLGALLKD
jgi:hypothetical protein